MKAQNKTTTENKNRKPIRRDGWGFLNKSDGYKIAIADKIGIKRPNKRRISDGNGIQSNTPVVEITSHTKQAKNAKKTLGL
jgi:hypothetical protein